MKEFRVRSLPELRERMIQRSANVTIYKYVKEGWLIDNIGFSAPEFVIIGPKNNYYEVNDQKFEPAIRNLENEDKDAERICRLMMISVSYLGRLDGRYY